MFSFKTLPTLIDVIEDLHMLNKIDILLYMYTLLLLLLLFRSDVQIIYIIIILCSIKRYIF